MYSEGTYNYLLSVQATLAAEGVTVDPTSRYTRPFVRKHLVPGGGCAAGKPYQKRRFNGELFLLYIIWYGLGRYWIEGLRTDA